MTPNTRSEQEGILFFKLYLLSRHKNYIQYMEQASKLVRWFEWRREFIDNTQDASIICGSCFAFLSQHKIPNGGIVHTCVGCSETSNWGYELNKLSDLTHLPFHTCMYLLVKAAEDIYKHGTIEQQRNITNFRMY